MNQELQHIHEEAMKICAPVFEQMKQVSLANTRKVLEAFRKHQLSSFHFAATNGYGYDDPGRQKLEEIWADVFHTEAALVRPQFVSGTHALATVLLALLRPGDTMVSAVGAPYDTMQSVIGLTGDAPKSLIKQGVHYKEAPLKDGHYDLDAIRRTVTPDTKLVEIQRSRGYMDRDSLFPEDIRRIIETVKSINPDIICFVDNCYGEFTCELEPTDVGADIAAGSLIKNGGGGIAPTGAYIVGRADLVDLCAQELTAPGLGGEMGSYAAGYRAFFEGLFMAPHVTVEAMMTAEYGAAVFHLLGFHVSPLPGHLRTDLITAVQLESAENMQLFGEAIQSWSPVDSFARPIPGPMPGYTDPILMAAGTFVQGSTIELSADGPVRPPYTMYMQGGLTFEHGMLAIDGAAENLLNAKKNK
jgi:cystathionine beta-lyase family protein involved in aluminum resistance